MITLLGPLSDGGVDLAAVIQGIAGALQQLMVSGSDQRRSGVGVEGVGVGAQCLGEVRVSGVDLGPNGVKSVGRGAGEGVQVVGGEGVAHGALDQGVYRHRSRRAVGDEGDQVEPV